jgi:signal peptidase I
MRFLRRLASRTVRLSALVGSAVLVLGWFFVFRPTSLGGPAGYVLVSGTSMEPTYDTGDLVITQRQDSYAVGDIVQFRVKRALLIHRIVGGDPVDGFLVRGDNNDVEDGFRPTPATIEGKAWLHLSGVGRAVVIIRQPLPLAICTWGAATFFLFRRWGRPRPVPAAGP